MNNKFTELEDKLEYLEDRLHADVTDSMEQDYLLTKREMKTWEKREAIRQGQIAKKKWLTEGDQNSKFFHAVINTRWNKASIESMKLDDGSVLSSPKVVHEVAVRHFQLFLFEHCEREQPDLGHLISRIITKEENNRLLSRLTKEEVKEAVKSILPESSLGPNGFGSSFFTTYWDFIKEDLVGC